jgi:outer membrane protein TolC
VSLDQVVSMGLENNPLIGAASEATNQAVAVLDQAKAGFGPTLDASLGATWQREAQSTYAFGPAGSVIGYVPLSYRNTYQAALTLTQTLYSGGTLTANRKAAELSLAAARADEFRTRQSVENAIQTGYFSLQRARAKLKVALENLSLTKEHLKQASAFYRAGVVAKNEVLRVQVAVSQAEQERIKADTGVQVAFVSLERAVGISLPGIVEDKRMVPPTLSLSGDLTGLALNNRAELTSLESSRKAAEQTALASAGRALPQVGLQGQVANTDDEFFPTEGDDWSISLGVSWRLYDSGEIRAATRQAQASARELLHRYDDMKNQILQQVTVASADLASATARIEVARDQVAQAQEDYRMALRRYESQVGTNIDVLDARVSLVSAQNSFADAIYDAANADANLIYAVGAGSLETSAP